MKLMEMKLHRLIIAVSTFAIACSVLAQASSDCLSVAKRDRLNCWSECPTGARRTEACVDGCNDEFSDAKKSCEKPASARAALQGRYKGGENGCYFGECPPDLSEKVETEKKRGKKRPPADENDDPVPPSPAVLTTNICQTPALWCTMFVTGPVGTSCFCTTPMGTAYGITVPRR